MILPRVMKLDRSSPHGQVIDLNDLGFQKSKVKVAGCQNMQNGFQLEHTKLTPAYTKAHVCCCICPRHAYTCSFTLCLGQIFCHTYYIGLTMTSECILCPIWTYLRHSSLSLVLLQNIWF